MKKNEHASGLNNVFKAIEDEDLSEDQVEIELTKLGISPAHLVKATKLKIDRIKTGEGTTSLTSTKEFNPYLLAAGSKKQMDKNKKLTIKLKKRPKT